MEPPVVAAANPPSFRPAGASEAGRRWDDRRVFLVGGGPSLRGFDFSRIEGRGRIVAVNEAAFHCRADALFSADFQWLRRRAEGISAFAGEKFAALPRGHALWGALPGVAYLEASGARGLSEEPGVIHLGGNSGYGALNLCTLKGARHITLLGFDFRVEGGRHHYHDEYSWYRRRNDGYLSIWARNFNDCKKQIKKAGIQIINANSISNISCFKKIPLEIAIKDFSCGCIN